MLSSEETAYEFIDTRVDDRYEEELEHGMQGQRNSLLLKRILISYASL